MKLKTPVSTTHSEIKHSPSDPVLSLATPEVDGPTDKDTLPTLTLSKFERKKAKQERRQLRKLRSEAEALLTTQIQPFQDVLPIANEPVDLSDVPRLIVKKTRAPISQEAKDFFAAHPEFVIDPDKSVLEYDDLSNHIITLPKQPKKRKPEVKREPLPGFDNLNDDYFADPVNNPESQPLVIDVLNDDYFMAAHGLHLKNYSAPRTLSFADKLNAFYQRNKGKILGALTGFVIGTTLCAFIPPLVPVVAGLFAAAMTGMVAHFVAAVVITAAATLMSTLVATVVDVIRQRQTAKEQKKEVSFTYDSYNIDGSEVPEKDDTIQVADYVPRNESIDTQVFVNPVVEDQEEKYPDEDLEEKNEVRSKKVKPVHISTSSLSLYKPQHRLVKKEPLQATTPIIIGRSKAI